jgi:hypothetical protein
MKICHKAQDEERKKEKEGTYEDGTLAAVEKED